MKPKVKTWLKQIESGQLKSNTVKILSYIIDNPNTNIHDMRAVLVMSHQTLTGCLSAIEDEGVVRTTGEVEIGGSFYSKYEYVSDPEQQMALALNRNKEKFLAWCRQGKNNFSAYLNAKMLMQLNKYVNGDTETGSEPEKAKYIPLQLF